MNFQLNDTLRQEQYLIKRIIGVGGFGITYEALHINFNHSVVIKTPNENLQNEPNYHKFVERFRQEGQIVFKLRHPHIVRVTDLFEENNLPCLVMEYITGENLYDYVANNGILTEEKALKYINQIGSALQKVHELQPDNPLIHRDATPLNIMINDEDNAILIDFGIAGELQSKFSTTRAFGNPIFAPPEQWRGIKHPTIDIYTLAGSLYFCLTGKPPQFNDDTDLIEPKKLNNSISNNVNNAIIKALQIKPSLRPQTMKEWLEMLKENKSKQSTVYPNLVGTWEGAEGYGFKWNLQIIINFQEKDYFKGILKGKHFFWGELFVEIEGYVTKTGIILGKITKVIKGDVKINKEFQGKLSNNQNEIHGDRKFGFFSIDWSVKRVELFGINTVYF